MAQFLPRAAPALTAEVGIAEEFGLRGQGGFNYVGFRVWGLGFGGSSLG